MLGVELPPSIHLVPRLAVAGPKALLESILDHHETSLPQANDQDPTNRPCPDTLGQERTT